jgi:RNA polymerase sigma factor (sigma-70 family)
MNERDLLAERFEANRTHLRAVAYRMLGSVSEADDAVQEAWLRLSRTDASRVENLAGWLTTVVARVSLDMLRSRNARREQPLGTHVPEPIVSRDAGADPEHEALIADSVGLALLVVLETLSPAERLAFVLHDMFGVPFDEIAPIVERSPAAARQLASRARRRVRGAARSRRRPPSRPRRRTPGRLAGGPRRGGGGRPGAHLRPARTAREAGARQRCGRVRGEPARTAGQRRRLHDHAREDRRDRPARRSGAPAPARPHGARRLSVGPHHAGAA